MLSLPVVLGLFAVGAFVLLFQGVALWLAREMPPLGPRPVPGSADPLDTVSVVIAARDEAGDLPATLDALLAQDYPRLQILVVEGGSRDATRSVIEARVPKVRLVEEPELPHGWVGKNWACWNGALHAAGAWLLFLDADVRLAPSAVRTLLAWAREEHAGLASLAPRVEMVGFWERTILPFYVQMVLTYFRAPHVNRDGSRTAMANGQCWLVRRADYEELGGHRAVRSKVLEDVALARRFRAAGKRLRLAWAPTLAVTRMYRDPHEMFEGILKNVHGTEFSPARQAFFLVALVGLFWLPLGVLPLGLATGSAAVAVLGLVLWVALFGKHVVLARALGAPPQYGLLYPVAVGWYVVLVVTSLRRGLGRGAVSWKGRSYPLERGPPTGP